MTAKDKADDLFVKMLEFIPDHVIEETSEAKDVAKRQALMICDALLEEIYDYEYEYANRRINYWQEVKQHLIEL